MTGKKIKIILYTTILAVSISFPTYATNNDQSETEVAETVEVTLEESESVFEVTEVESVEAPEVSDEDYDVPVASPADAVTSSGGSGGGSSSSGSAAYLTVEDLDALADSGTDVSGIQNSLDECVRLLLVSLTFQGIQIGVQCCLIFSQFWRWNR